MSHRSAYRLTARKVYPPQVEALGHVQQSAITLGQWDDRRDAEAAMARHVAASPDLYTATAAHRLVVTEI